MSNEFDIIKRADALLTMAHRVAAARRLASHQVFYPHRAKEAEEGNEKEPDVAGGQRETQLEPKRDALFERTKGWDYEMREIGKAMHRLETRMRIAVEADDERPKGPDTPQKQEAAVFSRADSFIESAGQK